MKQIEFFYDFRSPFAYFAFTRQALLTDTGATLVWRPVSVSGLLNLQVGRNPEEDVLDPMCPAKRAHFMSDIFRLIEYWNIPFAPPIPTPPAAEKAMAVCALLDQEQTDHSEFRAEIFQAIWQRQEDVQDDGVLLRYLDQAGFSQEVLQAALSLGMELLMERTKLAFDRGVFGVPTFIDGEELFFGADRMELLASRIPPTSRPPATPSGT